MTEEKQEKKIILQMRSGNVGDKIHVKLFAGKDKNNLGMVEGGFTMSQEVWDEFEFTMLMGRPWWQIERNVLEFDPNPPPPETKKVKVKREVKKVQ